MYPDSTLVPGIEVNDKAVRISPCTPDFKILDFSVAYDRYITPTLRLLPDDSLSVTFLQIFKLHFTFSIQYL